MSDFVWSDLFAMFGWIIGGVVAVFGLIAGIQFFFVWIHRYPKVWRVLVVAGSAVLGGFAASGVVWLAAFLLAPTFFGNKKLWDVVDATVFASLVAGFIGFVVGLTVSLFAVRAAAGQKS